jgi:hypothetical protein
MPFSPRDISLDSQMPLWLTKGGAIPRGSTHVSRVEEHKRGRSHRRPSREEAGESLPPLPVLNSCAAHIFIGTLEP